MGTLNAQFCDLSLCDCVASGKLQLQVCLWSNLYIHFRNLIEAIALRKKKLCNETLAGHTSVTILFVVLSTFKETARNGTEQ